MELLGFLFLLFIVLAAISSSSSDRDERRHHRDRYRDDHYRSSNRRHHHDDESDDYYYPPYYPNPYWPPPYPNRPRRPSGNTGAGILLGFFFAIVLVSVVAVYTWDGRTFNIPSQPKPVPEIKETTKGAPPRPLDYDEVPDEVDIKPLLPPKTAYDLQDNPHFICLAITDYRTFQNIRDTYPDRNIGAFLDESGRYWVGMFLATSEALDQERAVLLLREDDLKEHGLSVRYYPTSELCSGKIVREKGTEIWFCNGDN